MPTKVDLDLSGVLPKDRIGRFAESIAEAYSNGKHAVEASSLCRKTLSFFILNVAPSCSLSYGWVSASELSGEQFFKTPILIEQDLVGVAIQSLRLPIGDDVTVRYWPSIPAKTDPREPSVVQDSWWRPSLYFIQAETGGPVKIGLAQSIESRIETFQVGCPFRLVCLGQISNGSKRLEQAVHKQFANYRLHGEWFSDSEELQAYISSNAD